MNYLTKIDKLLDSLVDNRLSQVVISAISIALGIKDYDSWFILKAMTTGRNMETGAGRKLSNQYIRLASTDGISREEAKERSNQLNFRILQARKHDEENICILSVSELENYLDSVQEILEAYDLPEGLTPIDLYFENQRVVTEKVKTIQEKTLNAYVYSQFQILIAEVLTEMREKANVTVLEKNSILEGKILENIFIIHGHNEAKRRELCDLLEKEFNLKPIILQDQPSQGMTIIEKFEKYAKTCTFAFAIFTPDDIVENNGKKYFQARPNVIFELGWFYSNLGRDKVCILDQESEKSEIFSDLQGVMRLQFVKSVGEKTVEIRSELRAARIID